MRLTELNRPKPTTVAATLVLVAAAMLAGRGDAADPFARTVALESGGVAAPVTDRALRAPELPAVSVGEAKVKHDKGTPKLASSAYSDLDIPDTALAAYQRAAVVMEQVDESCSLSWTLLAAIGRVESDHERYAGPEPERYPGPEPERYPGPEPERYPRPQPELGTHPADRGPVRLRGRLLVPRRVPARGGRRQRAGVRSERGLRR